MARALTLIFVLVLAGCMAACDKTPPATALVVADTFCSSARKISWDHLADSAETAWQVEAHNRSIDRACARKRVAAK